MNRFLSALILLATCLPALAQTAVQQSGNVTPGHASCWTTNGIVQDCGTAVIPFLTSIGTVGAGPTICSNTAPNTSGAWQQLCLGGTTAGGAEIYVQNYGTAPAKNLFLNLNGTVYQFPFSSAAAVVGPATTTSGNIPLWNNTIGTLLSDSGYGIGTSGANVPLLNGTNTWSGPQTYTNSDILLLGSSTGATTFTSANASASNYTLSFPAATDTLTGKATTDSLTNKTITSSTNSIGGITAAFGSDAKGDIYTNSGSSNVIERLGIGSSGQCLIVTSGLPAWGSCSGASGITVGSTSITSGTPNGLLYDAAGVLGNLATANNGVLVTSNSGVPSISSTLPSALLAGTFKIGSAVSLPTGALLTVSNNVTGLPNLGIAGEDIVTTFSTIDGNVPGVANIGFGNFSGFVSARADGTAASPTALAAGDIIGVFDAHGFNGSAWSAGQGQLRYVASPSGANWTTGDEGTYAAIFATPPGSVSIAQVSQFNAISSSAVNITAGIAGTSVGSHCVTNVTSGSICMSPPSGALGTSILTLPDVTDTFAVLGTAQTFTATQTINAGTLTAGAQAFAVTATQPASPISPQNAVLWTIASNGSANESNNAINANYTAGYTGPATTRGIIFTNLVAGTSATTIVTANNTVTGNLGLLGQSVATTTGGNVGAIGNAGNGATNIGAYGLSVATKNSATNVGVLGDAVNAGTTPVEIGVVASLSGTLPTTSAALIADNGPNTHCSAAACPIALWQANSATVASVNATGGLTATLTNAATTSAVCYNTGSGLFSYDGTTGTCNTSDERLKNIGPRIDNALDRLLQINGFYFTYKDPNKYGAGEQIGVGAQTVEKVFPELVGSDTNGIKSVAYDKLVAPIIEAIRELKADNDNLRACQNSWKCRIFGIAP